MKCMLDSAILFWLILSALTFIIIGMFLMAYIMLMGDRRKRRSPIPEKTCAHFFGYLSSHIRFQAIPEECFGCTLAIDCIRAKHDTRKSGEEKQPVAMETLQQ